VHYKLFASQLEIKCQQSAWETLHGDDIKFEPNEPEAEAAIARYLNHVEKILRENKIAIDIDEAKCTGEPAIDENNEFYSEEEDKEYDSEESEQTQLTQKTYKSAEWHRKHRA